MIKTKHPIYALWRLQRKKLRRVLSEMRKNPALSPYVDAFLQKDDERHMALVALIACSEQTPERKHVRALDHVLSAEHRLREERDALGGQIDDLAACILEKIPGEPKEGESAVDVACRFIESRSDEANGSKWAWRAVPAVLQMLLEALQGDESKREAFTLLAHGACDKEEQVKVSVLVGSILRAGDNAYDARVADVTAAKLDDLRRREVAVNSALELLRVETQSRLGLETAPPRGLHEDEATRIARHVAHYIMNRETFAVYSAPPLDGATRVFMRTSERGWQILLGERRVHCSNLGAEARLECEGLHGHKRRRAAAPCSAAAALRGQIVQATWWPPLSR